MTEAYNMDCMDYLRNVPDKYFGLLIADPPYGINITTRHGTGTQTVLVGGGGGGPLEVKVGRPTDRSRKSFAKVNFTPCSTTAPRRTNGFSGSWNVFQGT